MTNKHQKNVWLTQEDIDALRQEIADRYPKLPSESQRQMTSQVVSELIQEARARRAMEDLPPDIVDALEQQRICEVMEDTPNDDRS